MTERIAVVRDGDDGLTVMRVVNDWSVADLYRNEMTKRTGDLYYVLPEQEAKEMGATNWGDSK